MKDNVSSIDHVLDKIVNQGERDAAYFEPQLSENALTVLKKRYLLKDENGNVIETPQEMFIRVARHIASAEKLFVKDADEEKVTKDFYSVMASLKFLPNSPTLMNAGKELGQLSACFVLPVEDSMESIFDTLKNTAIIHKSGGGTGFSFSRLRPQNDIVKSTKGVSSGPVSFMTVFDSATEAVKQGGTRRGANMGILRCDHPDILDFISCKEDNAKINNFNISVGITDRFMQALEVDGDYDLINPRSRKAAGKLRAKDVFDKVIQNSWKNGEPGIVFLDQINRDNPTPKVGEIESTNPCGEQPLLPYESCNLGSINLAKFVQDGAVDYQGLEDVVKTSVRFLDNVVEVNRFPLKKIEEMTKANRKIGLGVMGFSDMLLQLGVPYNSEEGIEIAGQIMSFINEKSKEASVELAKERGTFPNFSGSVYDTREGYRIRNACTTTIAPTGTISMIAGCSSGVEPLFAVCYVKNVMDGHKLVEINPLFEQVAKDGGFYSKELMDKIAMVGSLHKFDEIPQEVKDVFVTAHDITPEYHIKMQAAFQKYTDNAVSKTVNFSKEATVEDVSKVYMLAYKTGCKGVTIYRDGSRDEQVLSVGTSSGDKKEAGSIPPQSVTAPIPAAVVPGTAAPVYPKRKRPRMLTGKSIQMETGCGPLYVTINEDKDGIFELFNTMGKAGGCASSQSEAIGRLVSLAWRSGISPEAVIKQLAGISCHKHKGLGKSKISSCADAIGKAINIYLEDKNADKKFDISSMDELIVGACPDCGGVVEHEGGCAVCKACGYSECG
ncbi:MAG: vitamin B12-dependent ribonucleotide reductase [Candidatus Omnitrophica bacterium]|nr:vitamin B12-dependent ribonucleotide reductase [Candidatus Omnitrophota bacterium]